jgi:hypothetical protein
MTRDRNSIDWDLGGLKIDRPVQIEQLLIPEEVELHSGGIEVASFSGFRFHDPPVEPDSILVSDPPVEPDGILVSDFRYGTCRLDEPCLIWTWPRRRTASPGVGLLEQFTQLHNSTAEEVLLFVRRWGPLGLCEHNLPCGHLRVGSSVPGLEDAAACEPLYVLEADRRAGWRRYVAACSHMHSRRLEGNPKSLALVRKHDPDFPEGIRFVERLSAWRNLACRAGELLDSAARLNTKLPSHYREVTDAILSIRQSVNWWLSIANLRPAIEWNPKRREWQVRHEGFDSVSALSGHLALSLALAIANKDGYAICSSCNRSYVPARRPNPNRRNYCRQCGKNAAWRDATRDRRTRLRGRSTRPSGS